MAVKSLPLPGGYRATPTMSTSISSTRQLVKLYPRFGPLPPAVVDKLAFSGDGRRLAVGMGGGGGVLVFDPATGQLAFGDVDYGAPIYGVEFDHMGRLAVISFDGLVRLYDAAGKRIAAVKAPGGERPFCVAFSPDGSRLASATKTRPGSTCSTAARSRRCSRPTPAASTAAISLRSLFLATEQRSTREETTASTKNRSLPSQTGEAGRGARSKDARTRSSTSFHSANGA